MSYNPIRKDQIRCPYQPSHVIKKQKFIGHIEKCKLSSGKFSSMQQCRYNPYHFVNFNDIAQHQKNCDDRFSQKSSQNICLKSDSEQMSLIKKKPKKEKKKQVILSPPIQDKVWKQPDFQQWFDRNYYRDGTEKKDSNILSESMSMQSFPDF